MLTALKLRHFRCFAAFETEFAPGLNFIVGPNAHGKTSLLEAACILLRLQSPRATKLAQVIQHEQRGLVVDGHYAGRHLQFYFSRERKKLALDEVVQKTAHEYLQTGRLVWFANSDIDLARGAGDVRRRFLDFVAAQREPGYRTALREYERALRSRNLLLKSASPRWREIAAFDAPLVTAGTRVTDARRRLVEALRAPANARTPRSAARARRCGSITSTRAAKTSRPRSPPRAPRTGGSGRPRPGRIATMCAFSSTSNRRTSRAKASSARSCSR